MMKMKNETTMYALKAVFSLSETLNPAKVMYEMKNIHEEHRKGNHATKTLALDIKEQAPHPEVATLEARQEKILGQLAELKDIISSLRDMIKETNQSFSTPNDKCKEKEEEEKEEAIVIDLILRTNRKNIPYSLLAAASIWQDTKFNISCHSHSDDNIKSHEAGSFEKLLQSNNCSHNIEQATINGKNIVNLTLIWKNVSDMEMIKGLSENAILGETNVLRYLSRMIRSHNYESLPQLSIETAATQMNAVDEILDRCHQLKHAQSEQETFEIMKEFDNLLKNGKKNWLVSKNSPTIADFAAWSLIRSYPINRLSSNLTSWFERCQQTFFIK